MNVLVVLAHPNPESLNGEFFRRSIAGLKQNPEVQGIRSVDLYGEDFDPRLRFGKDKKRRDLHKDPEIRDYQEKILWADHMVFIYPIWWGRPPAILLGFFDRLMSSQFAYLDQAASPFPQGLLKGKSVTCISTAKGPDIYDLIWLRRSHKRLMEVALFHFVGIKKVKFFQFDRMEEIQGPQKRRLDQIQDYFQRLHSGNRRKTAAKTLSAVT
jgi:NAD(P)H dehydrogenase (quinone)